MAAAVPSRCGGFPPPLPFYVYLGEERRSFYFFGLRQRPIWRFRCVVRGLFAAQVGPWFKPSLPLCHLGVGAQESFVKLSSSSSSVELPRPSVFLSRLVPVTWVQIFSASGSGT